MIDLKIGSDGDLEISDAGDISLTKSIRQAVLIRLRWIYNEWRLGPELGFPWHEEMFVKDPDIIKLRGLLRSEIVEVDGVNDAVVDAVSYDCAKRAAVFRFTVVTDEETFREELIMNG